MRWSCAPLFAQRRMMLPVLGGISGWNRTMCILNLYLNEVLYSKLIEAQAIAPAQSDWNAARSLCKILNLQRSMHSARSFALALPFALDKLPYKFIFHHTDANNFFVYACCGELKTSVTLPYSTILPRYITAT